MLRAGLRSAHPAELGRGAGAVGGRRTRDCRRDAACRVLRTAGRRRAGRHRRAARRPRPVRLLRAARAPLRRAWLRRGRIRLLRADGRCLPSATTSSRTWITSPRRRPKRSRRTSGRPSPTSARPRAAAARSCSRWDSVTGADTHGSRGPADTGSPEPSGSTDRRASGTASRPGGACRGVRGPILALQAGADANILPEHNAAFDQALTTAGVEHELVVYDGAPHSFFDRRQEDYAEAVRRRVGADARVHRAPHTCLRTPAAVRPTRCLAPVRRPVRPARSAGRARGGAASRDERTAATRRVPSSNVISPS